MLGYRSNPPVSAADVRAFTCQVKRAQKFPLGQDYCVSKSGCTFFFFFSLRENLFPCSFSGWRYQKKMPKKRTLRGSNMCHFHGKTAPAQSVAKHIVSALAPAAYSKTSKHNGGQRERERQSYGCRMEAASRVLIPLSHWQAAPSGGGTRPESVAVLCLVCPWPPV